MGLPKTEKSPDLCSSVRNSFLKQMGEDLDSIVKMYKLRLANS